MAVPAGSDPLTTGDPLLVTLSGPNASRASFRMQDPPATSAEMKAPAMTLAQWIPAPPGAAAESAPPRTRRKAGRRFWVRDDSRRAEKAEGEEEVEEEEGGRRGEREEPWTVARGAN